MVDVLTANDRAGQYPASFYAATAQALPPFPPARGALRCDVCVVGGGYTGLSAALHLAQRGYDVVLLEAQRIGFGASGRNGGQVGTGQRVEQDALEAMVGREDARKLWNLSLASVGLVRDLIAAHDMNCGWRDGIIHADHRARFVPETHAYVQKLRDDYSYQHLRPLGREELRGMVASDTYHGGAIDMGGGHLDPLRFALGLGRAAVEAGVRIFEGARVDGISDKVTTGEAEVSADHIVLACNGYLGDLSGEVAAKIMPINNFIVATEPLDDPEALIAGHHAVADSKFVVNYFRMSDDHRLLFGGGESYGYRFPADIAAKVRKPMLEIFPQLRDVRIDHAWGGTLAITMNRMPHFARIAGNVLSVGGYSGHGVAMATLGGKLAAEAIAGQAESFDLMARIPTRRFPGGSALRSPLLVLAMTWFALRDRL